MNQIYLKSKRAVRFFFYRHLSIAAQLQISNILNDEDLIKQYWLLNKADRHHSFEVLNRSKKITEDPDVLILSLLHDIGKNTGHYSWLFRIMSDLNLVTTKKSKNYLDHELIGYEVLGSIDGLDELKNYYQKELLLRRHDVLEETDY